MRAQERDELADIGKVSAQGMSCEPPLGAQMRFERGERIVQTIALTLSSHVAASMHRFVPPYCPV